MGKTYSSYQGAAYPSSGRISTQARAARLKCPKPRERAHEMNALPALFMIRDRRTAGGHLAPDRRRASLRRLHDMKCWPCSLIDYTILTGSGLFSSLQDRQEPPHCSSAQNEVHLLVPASGVWGRWKNGSAEFHLQSWRLSPVFSLLFIWAQDRAEWHKHIELGNPDSFLPA